MNLDELQAQVGILQDRLQNLEDIKEIKTLQRKYGYYLDTSKWDEIIDLFSDDAESLELADSGVYLGKEGIKKFFLIMRKKSATPGYLHVVLQLQGIVDVEPSRKTAKGTWQAIALLALPVKGEIRPMMGHGVYVADYVREKDKWLFKKLNYYLTFRTPFEQLVRTPALDYVGSSNKIYSPYPAPHKVPFHFKHPITGK